MLCLIACLPASAAPLALALVRLVDQSPEPEDVKAGWTALVVFLLLAAAVALLGVSLTKHLRKAQAAEDAGLFGRDPAAEQEQPDPEQGSA